MGKRKNLNGNNQSKNKAILKAALDLFIKKGFDNVTVREIVQQSGSSMGNLYFHYKNKTEILNFIGKRFLIAIRQQSDDIFNLPYSAPVRFAIDLKSGLVTTLEDEKIYQLFSLVRLLPINREYSIENKKARILKFFKDKVPEKEVDTMAIALQGISDAFFKIRNEKDLPFPIEEISNLIVRYNLKLLGLESSEIEQTILEMESYFATNNNTITLKSVIENMVEEDAI